MLASVVAAFYYLRIIQLVYFEDLNESLDRPVGPELGIVITATGLFVTFFFVYPTPILTSAAAAAAALFAG